MNQSQPNSENASTSEELEEIDKRRKRAISKAVGAALLAWIVAVAVYAWLKSMQPRSSSLLDIILLLWNAVIIGAPFLGVWVYKKNK